MTNLTKQAIPQINYDPRRIAADRVAGLLMGALGLGVLGRGGIEVIRRLNKKEPVTADYWGYKTPMLMGKDDEEEDNKKKASVYDNIHKVIADRIYNAASGDSFLSGAHAATPENVPWYYGLGVPAAVATGIGAYGLTDKLLKRVNRRETEEEKQKVQQAYQELLAKALRSKSSSVLDDLADTRTDMIKAGVTEYLPSSVTNFIKNHGGGVLGLYGLMSLLTAGMTGRHTYNSLASRNQHKIIEEAKRLRSMRDLHGLGLPLYIETDKEKDDQDA